MGPDVDSGLLIVERVLARYNAAIDPTYLTPVANVEFAPSASGR
jgi:hypothetical protein